MRGAWLMQLSGAAEGTSAASLQRGASPSVLQSNAACLGDAP